MSERKRYLLRIDPATYAQLEKWAADDLRSVNAQIEFLLVQALERAGRRRTEERDAKARGDEGRGAKGRDDGSAPPEAEGAGPNPPR